MFLQTFLKNYAELAEKDCRDQLMDALRYLVKISEVEETEVFKVIFSQFKKTNWISYFQGHAGILEFTCRWAVPRVTNLELYSLQFGFQQPTGKALESPFEHVFGKMGKFHISRC